jgi:hypothetical protein
VAAGWGRVVWPNALDRGYPNAPGEWRSRTAQGRRLLVEGSVILPADVAPTLASPADALWLVPTRAFQAQHYALRPWSGGVLRGCADPAAAFGRWMERDAWFAAWLENEVRGLGLVWIEVDGSRSV